MAPAYSAAVHADPAQAFALERTDGPIAADAHAVNTVSDSTRVASTTEASGSTTNYDDAGNFQDIGDSQGAVGGSDSGSSSGAGGGSDSAGADDAGWLEPNSGATLSATEVSAVSDFHARATQAEPAITAAMQRLESTFEGSRLEGLNYRLKEEDSLRRKVAIDLFNDVSPSPSVVDQLARIKDSIRYTLSTPAHAFTETVTAQMNALKSEGFVLNALKNTFDQPGYKGINTTWRGPDGTVFEVQFHTPESFAAKMETHELYEAQRVLPSTDVAGRARLAEQMNELFDSVAIPESVASIRKGEFE